MREKEWARREKPSIIVARKAWTNVPYTIYTYYEVYTYPPSTLPRDLRAVCTIAKKEKPIERIWVEHLGWLHVYKIPPRVIPIVREVSYHGYYDEVPKEYCFIPKPDDIVALGLSESDKEYVFNKYISKLLTS